MRKLLSCFTEPQVVIWTMIILVTVKISVNTTDYISANHKYFHDYKESC